MKVRIEAFEKHYPWVETEGLRYFRTRTEQAPRDAASGMRFVLENARTREDQERCIRALERKCGILWRLLDAVAEAHARPQLSPHAKLRSDDPEAHALVVLPERAVKLNESGAEILSLCSGERTSDEIAVELRRRHPEVERLEGDVHEFLASMKRLGVLVG
jgi:coenzyme PQQ biosynthesis protein PqqD